MKLLILLDEVALAGEVLPAALRRQASEILGWDNPYLFIEDFIWQLIGNKNTSHL